MSDYVDEYREGFVPAVVAGPVLGQIDADGTFHAVVENPTASEIGKARQVLSERPPFSDDEIEAALRSLSPLIQEVRVTDPETGGQKGQKAEQYSLLPVEALATVARVYAYGAEKYSRNNWRLGYDWHLSYDAMQRHLNAFWGGEDIDPESGLPHLAHAIFHGLTLLTFLSDPKYKTKDDRA